MQILKNVLRFALKAISRGFLIIAAFFVVIALFVNLSTSGEIVPSSYDPIEEQREQIAVVVGEMQEDKSEAGKLKLSLYRQVLCKIIGEECGEYAGGTLEDFEKSVTGRIGHYLAIPYSYPAASGTYAVYQAFNGAGFIPQAMASEGIGFSALKPISAIWKVFRDVSYLIIVLFIVAIGFMIMFRMNINPQTVVTLENALPRIVITLILITFSYAIAGFLIDFMYILMMLSVSILAKADPSIVAVDFQNEFITAGPKNIYDNLFPVEGRFGGLSDAFAVGNAMSRVMPAWFSVLARIIAGFGMIPAWRIFSEQFGKLAEAPSNVGGEALTFGVNAGKLIGNLLSFITSGTILLILFAITVLFGLPFVLMILILFTFFLVFFKIFFLLIFAYTRALLAIVFAPIILLFEAVPGKNPFSHWFRGLIGELLTFPLVATFLLTGRVLIDLLGSQAVIDLVDRGPYIWQPPFLGGFDGKSFAVLLGFGILFLIPDLVKLVKELLGVKPLPLAIGPGTYFGGATGTIGGGLGILSTFSSLVFTAQILGLGERFGLGKGRGKPGGGQSAPSVVGGLTDAQYNAMHLLEAAKHLKR